MQLTYKKRSRKKIRRVLTAAFTAAVAAGFLLLMGLGAAGLNRSLRAEQLHSVQLAVQRAVVHCYALEGSYPPSLQYLQQNYGLVLDTKRYIYDYSVFAPNVPPEVHVLRK